MNEIAIEPGVAIREGTDYEETIQRYLERLEKLPPIVVFTCDKNSPTLQDRERESRDKGE